ncbi:MAG: hypothetical protein KF678_04505 [Phycisphaeraceae bacterium]|nr:hypothetical protein [Phycisphaeraceae bacterium]
MTSDALQTGKRVRITQRVPRQSGEMSITVEGTVVAVGQGKTGSWFAHGKDNKVWLDRVELRKDDGERIVMNLDRYSSVDVVG